VAEGESGKDGREYCDCVGYEGLKMDGKVIEDRKDGASPNGIGT